QSREEYDLPAQHVEADTDALIVRTFDELMQWRGDDLLQTKLASHPYEQRTNHHIGPFAIKAQLDEHRRKQHVDDILWQNVHESRLEHKGRDGGQTQRIIKRCRTDPVEPDIGSMWQNQRDGQNGN